MAKKKTKKRPVRRANVEYHEPIDSLPEEVRDEHRALAALREEVEAVDWYNQRAAATGDEELIAVLNHLQTEEIEHACMSLEWLRRHMPGWDAAMREILFTDGCIAGKCLRNGSARSRERAAERRIRAL